MSQMVDGTSNTVSHYTPNKQQQPIKSILMSKMHSDQRPDERASSNQAISIKEYATRVSVSTYGG